MILKIGTRGSDLALVQANAVKNYLSPNFESIWILPITTSGDKILGDLSKIGGKGLFLKELEEALLEDSIDIAVHSLKDVPAVCHAELTVMPVLKRAIPNDVFVSFHHKSFSNLPKDAIIGTCAPRRIAQLNQNLKAIPLRGNINTRLKKAENLDGVILAYCALERLSKTNLITEVIHVEKMLPAVGQGALAVQFKKKNIHLAEVITKITDADTNICIAAERAFLETVNGDCTTPLAALATLNKEKIYIKAMLATENGVFFAEQSSQKSMAIELGQNIADRLIVTSCYKKL